MPPHFFKGESLYCISMNRNKKSITLDLKSPEGKAQALRLMLEADVVIENLRSGALVYHRLPKPGKLEIQATKPLGNQRDLALAYSPGVAAACEFGVVLVAFGEVFVERFFAASGMDSSPWANSISWARSCTVWISLSSPDS